LSADLWRPLEKLRQQVDHLFDDFNRSPVPSPFGHVLFDVEPFWRRELIGHGMPAVDITEKDKSYEITAELPGMDQTTLTPDAVTLGQPFQCFVLGVLHGFNADERLAAFLLNLSQRLSVRGYSGTRFVLKMRREEIGSYLGLRLETVCRSIAHLRDLRLVTINSRNVEIHDLCGLTQLVAGCHRPPTF